LVAGVAVGLVLAAAATADGLALPLLGSALPRLAAALLDDPEPDLVAAATVLDEDRLFVVEAVALALPCTLADEAPLSLPPLLDRAALAEFELLAGADFASVRVESARDSLRVSFPEPDLAVAATAGITAAALSATPRRSATVAPRTPARQPCEMHKTGRSSNGGFLRLRKTTYGCEAGRSSPKKRRTQSPRGPAKAE